VVLIRETGKLSLCADSGTIFILLKIPGKCQSRQYNKCLVVGRYLYLAFYSLNWMSANVVNVDSKVGWLDEMAWNSFPLCTRRPCKKFKCYIKTSSRLVQQGISYVRKWFYKISLKEYPSRGIPVTFLPTRPESIIMICWKVEVELTVCFTQHQSGIKLFGNMFGFGSWWYTVPRQAVKRWKTMTWVLGLGYLRYSTWIHLIRKG